MTEEKPITWMCDMCGKERPDEDIGVITYPLINLKGAVRNLKYCNDRESCHVAAIVKSHTGEI